MKYTFEVKELFGKLKRLFIPLIEKKHNNLRTGSRFEQIDNKLIDLSKRLDATLTKDRSGYPAILGAFEERRIDWVDNGIFKAIIIQPNFERRGVNTAIWNFINIAWFDDGFSIHRPQWIKLLADKVAFEVIEHNIDELLNVSEHNLTGIKMADLK
ncbi:hypothetical protein [Chitinophaga sp. CF418]|uniref:hypothetical protein n=1 Tax=Chitinophaga sp. CF418 TaxID=1855287 RepID=UPI00091F249B|nr:hypothetical protein [Chitinophaga sp. CF418]SHN39701.1 hypothetical protein SAMN05216311_111238 [Chitinophaga sp. CF418]